MGEQVHIKLIGHGHADDLPPHQRGLGLFGPGELVDGQKDLEAQVPDLLDDALVAQGEGVKGAGEEGGFFRHVELEGAAFNAVGDDEAVDVTQGGGGIEEGQLLLRLLVDQEQDFLGHQGKQGGLVLIGQHLRGKQTLAQNPQGLLPHGLAIRGKTLQQEARHPAAPSLQHRFLLAEALGVDGVMLQHGAHGGKSGGHHAAAGGGEQLLHGLQHLIQLPGGQPQGKLPQVGGDVLGDFRLSGLQGLAQFHRDLVAPVRRQHRGDGQQGGAGIAADHHVFADLHQVGVVGGDVEHVGVIALLHLVQQVFHADGLQHPGSGGFQIVQKDAADRVHPAGRPVRLWWCQPQLLAEAGLEEQQRRAALAVGGRDGSGYGRTFRAVGLHGCQQMLEQPQRRGLLGEISVFQPPGGKVHQQLPVLPACPLQRQVQHRIQQSKSGVGIGVSGGLVVAEQLSGKAGSVGIGAV